MEAKKIETQAAQGDVLVRRVAAVPKGMVRQEASGDRVIVAHSETGHHHAIDGGGLELWQDPRNPLVAYLSIDPAMYADGGAVLRHHRPHDTHAPLLLGGGVWEVRRQREMTPDGWRQVQD